MSPLAPFLAVLLKRHPDTATLHGAGRAAGVSAVSIHNVLTGKKPRSVSVEKLVTAARVAGATDAELERLRVLAAMERGALPVPSGLDEERVARALAVLEGRA